MSGKMYIGLQSQTMVPCDLTDVAYEHARHTWLCTGCCVPKPGIQAVDVYLQETPRDKPLNFVNGCGVNVVFTEFLEKLPQDAVQSDLYLGNVFGPNGKQLTDWRTFRGRRRIIVRGSKKAGHRQCVNCGRDVYFAMGQRFLYPEPPKDVTLIESDLGLVLPQEIFAKSVIGRWPKLRIDMLPVLDMPRDGLGELLQA